MVVCYLVFYVFVEIMLNLPRWVIAAMSWWSLQQMLYCLLYCVIPLFIRSSSQALTLPHSLTVLLNIGIIACSGERKSGKISVY